MPNQTSSHHYEVYAGREIALWKEHVAPEKPVSKTGKPLQGGIERYIWIGYVGDTCVAHECGWQGGTKHEALNQCRDFAHRLQRTAKQAVAVTEALAFSDETEWFPIPEFVADLHDLTLSTDEVLKRYLAARRQVGIEIGAEV